MQYRNTLHNRNDFPFEDDNDTLILKPDHEEPSILTGHLKSNPETKVVVLLADEDNPHDTVKL